MFTLHFTTKLFLIIKPGINLYLQITYNVHYVHTSFEYKKVVNIFTIIYSNAYRDHLVDKRQIKTYLVELLLAVLSGYHINNFTWYQQMFLKFKKSQMYRTLILWSQIILICNGHGSFSTTSYGRRWSTSLHSVV